MQRRVHVARVDGQDADPFAGELLVPDSAQMMERRLARAVGAPRSVRLMCGVARHVHHQRTTTFPCGGGERPQQRLGQAKWANDVGREGELQILALGIGERDERNRPERRRVVDEHVEAAQDGQHLDRDRMGVVLARDVADDAVRAGRGPARRHRVAMLARRRRQRAPRGKQFAQGAAESRRAAGDRHAQPWQVLTSHVVSSFVMFDTFPV